MLTEAQVLELYRRENAVWLFDYDGDPLAPHAQLTSGLCTDGYVNSDLVLCDPVVVTLLATFLIEKLQRRNAVLPVDWVVGSAYGAITFSFEVARQLNVRHGFVKKDPWDPKRMVWDGTIFGGALVLRVEEIITTLRTAVDVQRAVEAANPESVRFLPDVATVIYRPVRAQGGLIDVIALATREIPTWPRSECPLCRQGSPSLRPKQNWRELTALGRK